MELFRRVMCMLQLEILAQCDWILLAARRHAPASWGFGIFGVVLLVVVLASIYTTWKDKKRTAALEEMARGLGFEFSAKADVNELPACAGLPLFSLGQGHKIQNLMRGASSNIQIAVFDYQYVIGGGKHRTVSQQTVICCQSEALALPVFTLAPKTFLHKVGALFGAREIAVEGHPLFSKSYRLRGDDSEAIRDVFNDGVLELFEQRSGWCAQTNESTIVVYQPSKRLSPAEIPELMERGLKVLSLMHAAV